VPAAVPVAVGVKITTIVQVLLAARLDPQLLFWVKALPLVAIPVRDSAPVPELVTVTDCGALAMPTPLEKVRVVGERVTAGVPVALFLWRMQPARKSVPARTTQRPPRLPMEKFLLLITPPPPSARE